MNDMERLVRVETQMARLVSDAESEKETRRRTNHLFTAQLEKFDERQRKMERTIWISTGALSVLMLILNLYLAWVK